jgi:hypothetical protein
MRLWSIHPRYLDAKGIVALWREGLLAKKVLEGKTIGYRHHPELERFKEQADPVLFMNTYLLGVLREAEKRGYKFSRGKLGKQITRKKIVIGKGRITWEFEHLKKKLRIRDAKKYQALLRVKSVKEHPIFSVRE